MIFAVSVDGKTIRCRPKTLIIPAEPIKCPSMKPAKPGKKAEKFTDEIASEAFPKEDDEAPGAAQNYLYTIRNYEVGHYGVIGKRWLK